MRIVAFYKDKGGVGSTTAVANVAAEVAHRGQRVAALDLDPAGHLLAWSRLGAGVLSKVVEQGDPDPQALRSRLDALRRERIDMVLLDCAPSASDAALAAVLLSGLVVVPATPSALDVVALRQTTRLLRRVRRGGRPSIALLPSRVTATAMGRDLAAVLASEGLPVLPAIAQRAEVAKATVRGLTVVEAFPSSASADAVRALTSALEELI